MDIKETSTRNTQRNAPDCAPQSWLKWFQSMPTCSVSYLDWMVVACDKPGSPTLFWSDPDDVTQTCSKCYPKHPEIRNTEHNIDNNMTYEPWFWMAWAPMHQTARCMLKFLFDKLIIRTLNIHRRGGTTTAIQSHTKNFLAGWCEWRDILWWLTEEIGLYGDYDMHKITCTPVFIYVYKRLYWKNNYM